MHILNSLGWLWRANGVELCIVIDGRPLQVFVPMQRVRLIFGDELAQVGYHEPPSVGDCSVGGMFDFVSRAAKSIGKATKSAIKRAASTVTRTASQFGSAALSAGRAVVTNPYVRAGLAAGSLVMPALAPVALGVEAANRYGSIARTAQNFVKRPSFGGAMSLASNAVPAQYSQAFNAARSFAQNPNARGLMGAANAYAPGVARQALQHFPGMPGGMSKPAARMLRRSQLFQRALFGR